MSDAIDRLVRESRPELGTREARDVNWAKVDGRLFERIEAEQRRERASLVGSKGRLWALVAGGLAAAAAVTLVVGKSHESRTIDPLVSVADETAGSVVSVTGDGRLLVDGKAAPVGTELHLGDVLETHGAQATVERQGKLTMVLEEGSRATVVRTQGALVLALERGAVEAQVVPVPSGEAFAVDVGPSRVAVHGTHLRVARSHEHVIVDLSEGVVSVGAAPRIGSTLGSLVTAPAHVEFTADDAEGTLVVSHDPVSVRTAVSVGAAAPGKVPTAVAAIPAKPETAEAHLAPAPNGSPHSDTLRPAIGAPGSHPPAAVVEPDPEASIIAAVRSCVASRPHADNVTVMLTTTVRLELRADGSVQSARFDPPVAPDVNGCASGPIYGVHFAHGGSLSVPVDVRVPSSAP
jgi:FecR protein